MKYLFLFFNITFFSFILHANELIFTQKPFAYQIANGTISGSYTLYCENNLLSTSDNIHEYKTIFNYGEIINNFIKINNLTLFNFNSLRDKNNSFNSFETMISDYQKDSYGLLIIDNKTTFPPLQNIPLFIKGLDFTNQKSWTSEGYEVQKLLKDEPIIRIPVKVDYQILNINDNKLTLTYEYKCNYTPRKDFSTKIKSIIGTSKTVASYDLQRKYILNEKYNRSYVVEFYKDDYLYRAEIKDSGFREFSDIINEDQNLISEYDKIADILKKNKNSSYVKIYNLMGFLALRLNKKGEAIDYFKMSHNNKMIRKIKKTTAEFK